MQEDGPPTGRGDAPRGLFTPRWVELQQTYGIERSQGWRSEMYIHRLPPSHGILHMPPWRESWLHMTSGLMNLLMILQVGLMIYGAGGHKWNGGSGESTRHLPPPVCPYCNT